MKMATVGERRVVVIRTKSGFHALDNACPHEGYGLTTGSLDGELLTCQWHNWKFQVADGTCVMGEESVACHQVRIEDDDVIVSVEEPSDEQIREQLWPSLQRGIERRYFGQIARDVARLLTAGADPNDLVEFAMRHYLPRTEWGIGHEMAASVDLLTISDRFAPLEQTLPMSHALAGASEAAHGRPQHHTASPGIGTADQAVFIDAIEREDLDAAVAAVRAQIAEYGTGAATRAWFIDAVSRHHYNYGHGAIYTHKSFEMIDRIPALADLLLEELTMTLVHGTREDTLPYSRKAMAAIAEVDVAALAGASVDPEWAGRNALTDTLLEATELPVAELVSAGFAGAGVVGLIDTVSIAASKRMLRWDVRLAQGADTPYTWLDVTHALTYANAARWAWSTAPGPAAARLVLLTSFLAFDAGRHERRLGVVAAPMVEPRPGDLADAVRTGRLDDVVAFALAGSVDEVATALEDASMGDTAGSFIVLAHLVKTAVAAREEAMATGSMLPLAATARFIASPRKERFVGLAARDAMHFVSTGRPPTR